MSAPLVVLFTAGYRYHFESGKIVQTGVLNVNSIPKGANVFLDGSLQKEKTPAVVGDVIPGKHEVRVEKSGYTSWKKTLEVASRQSTFATNIVLFLDQPPELIDSSNSTAPTDDQVEWQPTPNTFAIQQTQDRSVLSRIGDNQVASIIAYLPLSQYVIETTPAPYLLLRDETRGRIVMIDTNETTQPILLNTDATQWAWSPTGDALLFSDGFDIEVYLPFVHTRETITRFSQPISGLTWYPLGRIAVFGYGGDVFAQELDRRGETNKTTLVEGLGVKTFWFEDEGNWIVGVTEVGQGFRKRLQR